MTAGTDPAAPLPALGVDDEPLARRGVRARRAALGGVEIVGECAGGRDAVRAIGELAPDLVVLDVQMPGLDGFGVVDAVGAARKPPVIFVTAYDEHALRAFDAHVAVRREELPHAAAGERLVVGDDGADLGHRAAPPWWAA